MFNSIRFTRSVAALTTLLSAGACMASDSQSLAPHEETEVVGIRPAMKGMEGKVKEDALSQVTDPGLFLEQGVVRGALDPSIFPLKPTAVQTIYPIRLEGAVKGGVTEGAQIDSPC